MKYTSRLAAFTKTSGKKPNLFVPAPRNITKKTGIMFSATSIIKNYIFSTMPLISIKDSLLTPRYISYKKSNYPGCQVQGSQFRGSTWSHEPLSMPRLLNRLMKNQRLTVNGSANNH